MAVRSAAADDLDSERQPWGVGALDDAEGDEFGHHLGRPKRVIRVGQAGGIHATESARSGGCSVSRGKHALVAEGVEAHPDIQVFAVPLAEPGRIDRFVDRELEVR